VPSAPANFDNLIAGKVTDLNAYNDDAFKNYNEKALVPCPNCSRTFLPDSLKIHLRSCNKAHGKPLDAGLSSGRNGISGGSPDKGAGPAFVRRPKTVVCYLW
jgi:hypothetical protein